MIDQDLNKFRADTRFGPQTMKHLSYCPHIFYMPWNINVSIMKQNQVFYSAYTLSKIFLTILYYFI